MSAPAEGSEGQTESEGQVRSGERGGRQTDVDEVLDDDRVPPPDVIAQGSTEETAKDTAQRKEGDHEPLLDVREREAAGELDESPGDDPNVVAVDEPSAADNRSRLEHKPLRPEHQR